MKLTHTFLPLLMSLLVLCSCEENITVELEKAEPQIVIDAWVNNTPVTQVIRITETLPYFDSMSYAGVQDAMIQW